MAFAYLRVAETLAKMGEPVAAMEYSRHALSIAEALRTANPEDVISLAQVAEAHVRIGDAEVDLGRKTSRDQLSRAEHHRKACASYRMALKSYRELEQRRVAEEWDQENAQHVAQQVALCAPN
jgi:hypothetical protein